MPAGSSRHIEPLIPDQLGDPIAWQSGGVLQWQSGEAIVWQSFFGPSLMWARTAQHHAAIQARVRRPRVTQVVPSATVITTTFVPAVAREARTLRGIPRRRMRITEVGPGALAPVDATRPRKRPTARPPQHRPRVEVIPPQFNPPLPIVEAVQPRRVRGLLARRARRAEAPLTQAIVTTTDDSFEKLRQARTFRGLSRRRGRGVEVTPPQVNPPFPFAELVQPRRMRGILRGKARYAQAPLEQAFPIESRARRRFLGRTKTRRPIEAPVAQQQPANPDFAWPTDRQARTVRGVSRRRGRGAEVVPAQVTPAAPAFVTSSPQPRRLRGLVARRARRVEVVHGAGHPVEPRVLRGKVRGIPRGRRARVEVVPPQQTVADPSTMWSHDRQPRVLRGISRARGRRTDVVQPQLNPPYPFVQVSEPRRLRGLGRLRGRRAELVPDQPTAFVGEIRFSKVSRVRRLGRRQRRPGFDTFGQPAGPTSFVKTWDGLPRASIKTFDGVANASTKTVDGLP